MSGLCKVASVRLSKNDLTGRGVLYMRQPNTGLLKFIVFLLVSLATLSSIVPAGAAGDSIDSITVTVPVCGGFAGRLDVTFTVSGGTRWLTAVPGNSSFSRGIWSAGGTFTESGFQYIPNNLPAGTIIPLTVKLGTTSFNDDVASKTIFFNCTTGQVVNPPAAVDDSASTGTNTPVTIDVAANDTDADGDLNPASAHSTVDPTHGTLVNNNDGTFTYTPTSGFNGTDGFDYEICDAISLCDSAHVAIEVINLPPDCSLGNANDTKIWPPNHRMVPVMISGVTDPEGNPVTIVVDNITSNEPENGTGDGDTAPDFTGVGTDSPMVRAERAGHGSGREYTISFTADDGNGGTCSGSVVISVPKHPDIVLGHSVSGGSSSSESTVSTDTSSSGGTVSSAGTASATVSSSGGNSGGGGSSGDGSGGGSTTIIITVTTGDGSGHGGGKGGKGG
jgi:Big-like domain-containing protein